MCIKWIDFQGARILYQDFSGGSLLDVGKVKEEFVTLREMITSQPFNSVRILANFNESYFSKDLLDVMVEHTRLTHPYIKKYAALGVTGPKRIMAGMVQRLSGQQIEFFDGEQSAQQWLTEG